MISYDFGLDQWSLSYDPANPTEQLDDGIPAPQGQFTAQATVQTVTEGAIAGLFWRVDDEVHGWAACTSEPTFAIEPNTHYLVTALPITLRVEYADEVVKLSSSVDGLIWAYEEDEVDTPVAPTEVGVVLVPDAQAPILAQASITQYRLLTETPSQSVPEIAATPSIGSQQLLVLPLVQATAEPIVHGLVGAQFGDLEFDAGKSVRWLEFFTDDLFIVDINTGDQRYWVINWSASFPDSEHTVTGRNFFANAPIWRKEQFEAATKEFTYNDEDWVLFVDGHEGMSFDNRSLPDDYDAFPFMSFLYREIARIEAAGQDIGYLPFFVYLTYSDLQNITYSTAANDGGEALGIPAVQQAVSVPWYLPQHYLARLVKVSRLRNLDFDWSIIDTPDESPPYDASGAKAQVLSYGYAHWSLPDIPPGETTVPPLTADNDLGWKMRNMLSRVRPIPGIPFGDTWQDPSTDPDSLPGPWCVDTMINVDTSLEPTVEEDGHTEPDAATAGIRVPLYDTVMRLNLRDGLWYERGNSGNVPITWDDVHQVWVPRYDPAQWVAMGVDADSEPEPPPSTMSLSLDGSPGTYANTSDSPYLDYADAFTLMSVVALNDWSLVTDQNLISKWDEDEGQKSYRWYIESGHMHLAVNQDVSGEYDYDFDTTSLFVNEAALAIAIEFVMDSIELEDQVKIWLYEPVTGVWNQWGDQIKRPNPNQHRIVNSTAEVRVGEDAAGLFRLASVRQGVGEGDVFGGTEYARMRGDITSNPCNDRYGNTWVNHGGWSYVEMTNIPV